VSSPDDFARYARQMVLPAFGVEGQKRLRAGSAIIIGAGGLGSPVALYLAAAGVGRIGIIDADVVDRTNLHRQILFSETDIGSSKVEAAAARLSALNSSCRIVSYKERLTSSNALEILKGYDVIIDASDNFPTRYLVNDAAVMLGIPNVYGSIFRLEGQASLFVPRETACYRCLYPTPPGFGTIPTCEEGGVLGSIAGIVGSIQATETLKFLGGMKGSLRAKLLLIDAAQMTFRSIAIKRNPRCVVCGDEPSLLELIDYEQFCGGKPMPQGVGNITPAELNERMAAGDKPLIIDVREQHEWDLGHLAAAQLRPLSKWPAAAENLDPDSDIIMVCRSGGRSMRAGQVLVAGGFRSVKNLEGGMLRWSAEIDSSIKVQ